MTGPIALVDGTFPGTNPHASYKLQLQEIGPPHVPTLVELPEVGPHVTGLGKVVANFSLPFELRSYGWQLQRGERRTAVDQRRAISHRNSVIQALADVAQDTDIPEVSVRLLGPVATMVSGMLPSGQRILRDAGARADIAAAWADGATNLASKISDVVGARTTLIVQEHDAHQAVEGKIRSVSGADIERALEVQEVRSAWQLASEVDATVLVETNHQLLETAAEAGAVVMDWPTGQHKNTERAWELIDGLVTAETPVALGLTYRSSPERYAEELIQQYVDWGLDLTALEHLRLMHRFDAEPEVAVGAGLEWLRTVADHAASYVRAL